MISCNVTTCIGGIILILNMMVSYACMVLKEHTNMLHVGVVDCAVGFIELLYIYNNNKIRFC